MQPSNPIKHTKSSLNQELRMMANKFPTRRPQPNPYFKKNNNSRPQGFPNHRTFKNPPMIPSNNPRNIHSMTGPVNRSGRYGSFMSKRPIDVNTNMPQSMAGIKSPNQLGASRSFAPGFQMRNNPSINHSNVISVGREFEIIKRIRFDRGPSSRKDQTDR